MVVLLVSLARRAYHFQQLASSSTPFHECRTYYLKSGIPARELCRKHGISDATFYTWRKKYAGLDVSEARRLKALEDENARLKKLLAETLLDAEALKIALS